VAPLQEIPASNTEIQNAPDTFRISDGKLYSLDALINVQPCMKASRVLAENFPADDQILIEHPF
jgi:hypothetical protein